MSQGRTSLTRDTRITKNKDKDCNDVPTNINYDKIHNNNKKTEISAMRLSDLANKSRDGPTG